MSTIDLEKRTLLLKEEAAEILRVSVRKIEYMIEEGDLKAVRVGERSVRIPVSEIKKIITPN